MTFQLAATSYSCVAPISNRSGPYGVIRSSRFPTCSWNVGADPETFAKTQPCHSVVGTGTRPSWTGSEEGRCLNLGAPFSRPSSP